MSLTRLALAFAAPTPKIESFRRYLFIGPHPDDIEIGAGATAAKLAASGKDICFLICTDGRYGDGAAPKGLSREDLVELRKEESRKSAQVLGVRDLRFLGLSDGGFYEDVELLEGIAAVMGEFKPDCVFAPDPWVSSECHADHLRCGQAARQLSCFAPYAGIMERLGASEAPVKALCYYMTAKPTAYVKTRGFTEKQFQAIFGCHLSQFPKGSDEAKSIALYLKLRSADMGLRCLSTAGEGFRTLGQIHMHCLPEAGK